MKLFFIVFCTAASIFGIIAVDINKCSSKNLEDVPTALHFESIGCVEPPCPLYRGTVSDANVTFRVPYDVAASTVKIQAKLAGSIVWVPFFPDDTNTCHNLINSYCPLDENEEVTYHLAISILKNYPLVAMTLRIQFLDDEEKPTPMMCVEIPCEVVDQ